MEEGVSETGRPKRIERKKDYFIALLIQLFPGEFWGVRFPSSRSEPHPALGG